MGELNKDNFQEMFELLNFNLRAFKKSYLPSYNDLADYNTNAQSYYDYLAKFNKLLVLMVEYINELMKRKVEVEDTDTVDMTRVKNWINCYKTCGNIEKNYDTVLKADVIFSKENVIYSTLRSGTQTLDNATYNLKGVFTPNFKKILDLFDNDINENLKKILKNIEDIKNHYNEFLQFKSKTENDIKEINQKIDTINQTINQLKQWHNENLIKINKNITDIKELKNDLENMSNMLLKIVKNLYQSGAIDSENQNFTFINNIANGNINLFTKSMDSNFYIKTNKNQNDNDLALGVD